jgi:phenylpropionate dioxygenase-like ring-hydroxylating dioxygenase large terminal subunit
MDAKENALITSVGVGSPMGRLLRRYWVPVMRSTRLEPGAAPLPFRALAARYVAFRATDGRVAVFDEGCPHRGASLALARTEGDCLRCIYHGWKLDAAGRLLEAPTHPAGARLDKVATGVHPVREDCGMIWTWLGDGAAPPFPTLAFTGLPADHVVTATAVVEANWVQMFESLWDTFHAQILHNRANRVTFRDTARLEHYFSEAREGDDSLVFDLPAMSAEATPWGFAYRSTDDIKELNYAHIFPWYLHHTVGPDPLDDKAVQIHVPLDDDHTLFWQVMYNRHVPLAPDGYARRFASAVDDPDDLRRGYSKENRWRQDREAMNRGDSFTGIGEGRGILQILLEDFAVIESQGRLDRTGEHLGPVDLAVIAGRKMLLRAVEAEDSGDPPFARDEDVSSVEAVFDVKPASLLER